MLLALFGVAVGSGFALLNDVLSTYLPADAWTSAQAFAAPLAFLVPPTFASTVPLAMSALVAAGGVRLILNLVGRK